MVFVLPVKNPRDLYIGGSFAAPVRGQVEDVLNPATEEVTGSGPVGSVDDSAAAVLIAREAFDAGPWPRLRVAERIDALRRFLRRADGTCCRDLRTDHRRGRRRSLQRARAPVRCA